MKAQNSCSLFTAFKILIAGVILCVLAFAIYLCLSLWANSKSRTVDLAEVAKRTGINFPKSAILDGAVYDPTNSVGEYILHARVTMRKDDLTWFMKHGFTHWEKGSPYQFSKNYTFESYWADAKAKSAASWWKPGSLRHWVGVNIFYGGWKSMDVLIEQPTGKTFTVYIEDKHF